MYISLVLLQRTPNRGLEKSMDRSPVPIASVAFDCFTSKDGNALLSGELDTARRMHNVPAEKSVLPIYRIGELFPVTKIPIPGLRRERAHQRGRKPDCRLRAFTLIQQTRHCSPLLKP